MRVEVTDEVAKFLQNNTKEMNKEEGLEINLNSVYDLVKDNTQILKMINNSVDSEYVRQTTEKFNEKVKEDNLFIEQPQEQQDDEQELQLDEISLDEEILELNETLRCK